MNSAVRIGRGGAAARVEQARTSSLNGTDANGHAGASVDGSDDGGGSAERLRRPSLYDIAKHHTATDEEARNFWVYLLAWVSMYGAITFWVGGCECSTNTFRWHQSLRVS